MLEEYDREHTRWWSGQADKADRKSNYLSGSPVSLEACDVSEAFQQAKAKKSPAGNHKLQ